MSNAAVDRRPALIACCEGPRDVAAALRHARQRGMAVTVRAAATHQLVSRSLTAR